LLLVKWVEKSKKKPLCDAKFGKHGLFWGDRLAEPKRDTSIIIHLRATQPPPEDRIPMDSTANNVTINRGMLVEFRIHESIVGGAD